MINKFNEQNFTWVDVLDPTPEIALPAYVAIIIIPLRDVIVPRYLGYQVTVYNLLP